MKIRVISAIAGLGLLISVVLLPVEIFGIAVFALALVGIYEFYNAVSNAGYRPVKFIGYLTCIPLLLIGIGAGNGRFGDFAGKLLLPEYFTFVIFIVLAALMAFIVFLRDRYNLLDICLTVFGVLYVIFLLSFVLLTRNLEHGRLFIWLIFIGAWATDTFAYFAGVTMGKTKLIPAISPKKTVEGSVGGIIGCVLITVLYGLYINTYLDFIPVYHYVIIGLLSGSISQIGDLAASAIKRYVNIKDYGYVMPGHGGALDRFDSILFVAPVIYFYIKFFIH